MRSTLLLTFSSLASAGVVRRQEPVCFCTEVRGANQGPINQIDDGQLNLDTNYHGLGRVELCLHNNGILTDANGKGCIITSPQFQFQCDYGNPGMINQNLRNLQLTMTRNVWIWFISRFKSYLQWKQQLVGVPNR